MHVTMFVSNDKHEKMSHLLPLHTELSCPKAM